MFSYLKGKIKYVNPDYLCLTVNDVGYKIEFIGSKLYSPDSTAEFYIYTHVREDAIRLFGFDNQNELCLFEDLITVSGVGPKTAMQIMTVGESLLTKSIISGNLKAVKIKGVGTKTLEKIVLELSSKFKDNPKYQAMVGEESAPEVAKSSKISQDETDKLEIFEALQNLGFKVNEISESYKKVEELKDSGKMSSQEIIKLMLQHLRNR
ncbi:MAG: Holliday junction branch migration protein RuvA [bacterium]